MARTPTKDLARSFLLSCFLLLFAAGSSVGQVWQLDSQGGALTSSCVANAITVAPGPVPLIPGFGGFDLGGANQAVCKDDVSSCHTSASGGVEVLLDGLGTRCVTLRWYALSQSQHSCFFPAGYLAQGTSGFGIGISLVSRGVPDGTPATVFWRWQQTTTDNYDDPDGPPDESWATFGSLTLNGADLFNGDYDLVDVRGWLVGGEAGNFDTTIGTVVNIAAGVSTEVDMEPLPEVPCCPQDDGELVSYAGDLLLCIGAPPPPPADPNSHIEFSIDMGSETSLMDVLPAEGDEVFDPGDMYLLFDTILLPPLGIDGLKDDVVMDPVTGTDPPADAPGANVPDSCSGTPLAVLAPINADTDGSDTLPASMAASLRSLLFDASGMETPLPSPLPMSPSACTLGAENLLLSYDDDGATDVYMPGCDAPAAAGSPIGETYGSFARQDEVIELSLFGAGPPYFAAVAPIADEAAAHVSMGPDPVRVLPTSPADQAHDDDIDALDATTDACDEWLFSLDHEASLGASAGTIYRATATGLQPVVTPAHLGLPPGVDLRGFEFVVTPDPTGASVLTVLFSVAPDDPGTPADETGGLNPRMIYSSFLTGTNAAFLVGPLQDAVDAITAVSVRIGPAAVDTDSDGVQDAADCAVADPSVWTVPGGPVENLFAEFDPARSLTVISWSAPQDPGGTAPVYDGFAAPYGTGGPFPAVFGCLSSDGSATSFTDTSPPVGTARLYVVRPETTCGNGPAGSSGGGLALAPLLAPGC